MLLNLESWASIFLVVSRKKWEVCCKPKYDWSYFEEKLDWGLKKLQLSWNTMFTWKDWQTMVILPFAIYFLKKEQREPVISRTASFCCQRYKTDFLSFIFYEIFLSFMRFLKNLCLLLWAWQLPQPKEFSNEMGGDVNKCDLKKYFIMKCVNICNTWITQWTNILQITSAWCHKIMHGQKIHSKYKTDQWIVM